MLADLWPGRISPISVQASRPRFASSPQAAKGLSAIRVCLRRRRAITGCVICVLANMGCLIRRQENTAA